METASGPGGCDEVKHIASSIHPTFTYRVGLRSERVILIVTLAMQRSGGPRSRRSTTSCLCPPWRKRKPHKSCICRASWTTSLDFTGVVVAVDLQHVAWSPISLGSEVWLKSWTCPQRHCHALCHGEEVEKNLVRARAMAQTK